VHVEQHHVGSIAAILLIASGTVPASPITST
jgi:hypothetical protein